VFIELPKVLHSSCHADFIHHLIGVETYILKLLIDESFVVEGLKLVLDLLLLDAHQEPTFTPIQTRLGR
jgi:hypothetical protein